MIHNNQVKNVALAFVAAALLVTSTTAPALAATTTPYAATNNTTTTAHSCGSPDLQQARLYTDDPTVKKDNPGVIAGTIVSDVTNNCDIVVQLTLTVPNGMYIQGSGDVGSGGAGVITNTFTVKPGQSKSLRATVYSNNIGDKTVTADITYFPEGEKDKAKELDGQMLEFSVREKTMPDDTTATTGTTAAASAPPNKEMNATPANQLFGISWPKAVLTIVIIALLFLVGLGMLSIRGALPDSLDIDIGLRK